MASITSRPLPLRGGNHLTLKQLPTERLPNLFLHSEESDEAIGSMVLMYALVIFHNLVTYTHTHIVCHSQEVNCLYTTRYTILLGNKSLLGAARISNAHSESVLGSDLPN